MSEAGYGPWSRAVLWFAGLAAFVAILMVVRVGGPLSVAGPLPASPSSPPPSAPSMATSAPPSPRDIPAGLKRQAAALVRGDEPGWLAGLDPDRPDLLDTFRHQYAALHALGVTSFQPVVAPNDLTPYVDVADVRSLTLSVRFAYCVQVDSCPAAHWAGPVPATEYYLARVTFGLRNDAYLITGYEPQPSDDDPPWLDPSAGLTIRTGNRVVVVAPPALANQIDRVLPLAEAAAEVADRYAHWARPTHYLVYLADPPHWTAWFRGDKLDPTVNGVAASVSSSSVPVMLKYNAVPFNQLSAVLRHEFGHVASFLGAVPAGSYLAEGFAELVEHDGGPVHTYDRLPTLRQYVYSGAWDGDIDAASTSAAAEPTARLAAYAIGFLTWRCIQDRFGDAAMFDFAGRTMRERFSPAGASATTLGVPWSDVKAGCAEYIRSVL